MVVVAFVGCILVVEIWLVFLYGSKDDDKTGAACICSSFEFSKYRPDKATIFTAELGAIISALRYIKSTTR